MPEPKPDFKPITRKSADASQLPAGHARDEQIKVNADANAQRIEQAADTSGAINPAAFAPDREILAYTDGLEVTDLHHQRNHMRQEEILVDSMLNMFAALELATVRIGDDPQLAPTL